MEFKNHFYNLITMKKTILFLLSIVIFSGCAGFKVTKRNYSKDSKFEYSGGEIIYGIGKGLDSFSGQDVGNKLREFCENREFQKLSETDEHNSDIFILIPYKIYEKRLTFECIDEKK